MSTPPPSLLDAASTQVTALIWYAATTATGLTVITLGSGIMLLGHPWHGLAAALLGAGIYREQCYRTPYTTCVRCHGTGHRSKTRRILPGRTIRRCGLCRGKGVRIRWGRSVMNTYRRTTHTSKTTTATATGARPAEAAGPVSYAEALQRATQLDRPTRGGR